MASNKIWEEINKRMEEGLNDEKYWQDLKIKKQQKQDLEDFKTAELAIRHNKVMRDRNIIISVYTNATGFLWSMAMVDSGAGLGHFEYNGDCEASGSFTTYNKAFEDALLIAEKFTLDEFRGKSKKAHWSNYANFVRTLEKHKVNQCDGCMANLPIKNGIHQDKKGMGFYCTKDRYS